MRENVETDTCNRYVKMKITDSGALVVSMLTLLHLSAPQLDNANASRSLQNRSVRSGKFRVAINLRCKKNDISRGELFGNHELCLLHENVGLEGLATSCSHASCGNFYDVIQS